MTTRGVLLPSSRDPAPFARRIEKLGYDRLWVGELWSTDPFVQLTRAAEVPIDLATAVVNVYSRTPAAIAQAIASVADIAAGEVALGLGTSTPTAIESIHGLAFDRPIRRLHETTELVGDLLRSETRVEYDGELVSTRGTPGLDVDVPVYTAALGPAARRATGRVADGWIPHNVPFGQLAVAFEAIAETARERGRDPDDVAVLPYVPCAASEDESRARDAIRGHLAYYVGSGEGYRNAVAMSFPDRAERIASAWNAGERDRARDLVTPEMVDALGVAGTPETIRERFADAIPDLVDGVCVHVPETDSGLVAPTIRALAPDQ
jgi:alkanesulfonate monooxygenase SsuD/methylene tetrahydromethanopterin reductase-like flavin-dependent oxidoreductase (luciferase family)